MSLRGVHLDRKGPSEDITEGVLKPKSKPEYLYALLNFMDLNQSAKVLTSIY